MRVDKLCEIVDTVARVNAHTLKFSWRNPGSKIDLSILITPVLLGRRTSGLVDKLPVKLFILHDCPM